MENIFSQIIQSLPRNIPTYARRLPKTNTRPYLGPVKSLERASPEMEGIPEAKRKGKTEADTATAILANSDPMSIIFLLVAGFNPDSWSLKPVK